MDLKPGEKCFVVRNNSSVIGFKLPENIPGSFMIIASHSDSPTFKIKPNPEIVIENNYIKLNVEKYGGMIYTSWLEQASFCSWKNCCKIRQRSGNKVLI